MDITVKILEGKALQQFVVNDLKEHRMPLTAKNAVNCIRHRLTPYDAMMNATRKAKDGYATRATLRIAVLEAIATAYRHLPLIATEAKRQLREELAYQYARKALP